MLETEQAFLAVRVQLLDKVSETQLKCAHFMEFAGSGLNTK